LFVGGSDIGLVLKYNGNLDTSQSYTGKCRVLDVKNYYYKKSRQCSRDLKFFCDPISRSNVSVDSQIHSDVIDVSKDLKKSQNETDLSLRKNDPNALSIGTAYALLNLVAVIWGSQHALIKLSTSDSDHLLDPSMLNAVRFSLSALICLPVFAKPNTKLSVPLARAGTELGAWMFLGFALQAVGLLFTTAGRSAFLLYLNVKLVPILAFLLYGRQASARTWISAAIAVTGTALLSTSDANVPPNLGDLLSIAAAGSSAMFILRLETFARQFPAAELNAVSVSSAALFSVTWAVITSLGSGDAAVSDTLLPLNLSSLQIGTILYLGVISTALCNWAQTAAQRIVSAEKSALVYAMDPVYAAIFAYFILHETLPLPGLIGAGFVTLAAIYSREPEQNNDETSNER